MQKLKRNGIGNTAELFLCPFSAKCLLLRKRRHGCTSDRAVPMALFVFLAAAALKADD